MRFYYVLLKMPLWMVFRQSFNRIFILLLITQIETVLAFLLKIRFPQILEHNSSELIGLQAIKERFSIK